MNYMLAICVHPNKDTGSAGTPCGLVFARFVVGLNSGVADCTLALGRNRLKLTGYRLSFVVCVPHAIELSPDTLSFYVFSEGTIAFLLVVRSKPIIKNVTERVDDPCFQVPKRHIWRKLHATLQKRDGLNTIMRSGQGWGYNPDFETSFFVLLR